MDANFLSPLSGSPSRASIAFHGSVEKIIFRNEDNGYCVLVVCPDQQSILDGTVDDDSITCVGCLLKVEEAMRFVFRGSFIDDPRYGLQFRFSSAEEEFKSDARSLELYLASGVIDQVGKALARRIVKKFGEETSDILTNHPERLLEVRGISEHKAAQIKESWDEKLHLRRLMEFLQVHAISVNMGMSIYKKYGDKSLSIVQSNPYLLMEDIKGIGFAKADTISLKVGIGRHSPIRIEAGILSALSAATSDGHVFLTKDELIPRAAQILGEEDTKLIEKAIKTLETSKKIVLEKMEEHPSREDGKKPIAVYLKPLHICESKIAFYLNRILDTPPQANLSNPDEDLLEVLRESKIRIDETQLTAIKTAARSKVMVLTGGPGTGKTTIIKLIIQLFSGAARQIGLAAPTGRAAKRMSEATQKPAMTIHRLLQYNGEEFAKNEDDQLPCDLLIIDEASMMDVSLFYHLLKAVPSSSRLILVGDVHQLPSVGPGSVLSDIISSKRVPVSELTKIYRQKNDGNPSDIVTAAQCVNEGRMPELYHGYGYKADFFFIPATTPESAAKNIIALVQQRLPNYYKYDPIEDIQVLCPMNKGTAGTESLNKYLQNALNPANAPQTAAPAPEDDIDLPWDIPEGDYSQPQNEEEEEYKQPFRVGDKVMQTKNNYDIDVFNGDVGRVKYIDTQDKSILVEFDEKHLIKYSKPVRAKNGDLSDLVLSYATSIHKSQGSEYKAVVIPLLMQQYIMLQRNLLYTAITRGKEVVVIVGQHQALKRAVDNNVVTTRNSRLLWRISNQKADVEEEELGDLTDFDAQSLYC